MLRVLHARVPTPANSVDDSRWEFRKVRGLHGIFDSQNELHYFPHVYNITHIVQTINAQHRKGTSKLNAMRWSGPACYWRCARRPPARNAGTLPTLPV